MTAKILIVATVKMMVLTDEKRWQDLRSLFANPIVIDYTSLTGGQPATIDPSVSYRMEKIIRASSNSSHDIKSFSRAN
jgi:hypothetical protein